MAKFKMWDSTYPMGKLRDAEFSRKITCVSKTLTEGLPLPQKALIHITGNSAPSKVLTSLTNLHGTIDTDRWML